MKVAFHTLGCKVNQYETEGIKEKFKKSGYEIVQGLGFADIYVINTCTVTNLADRKSRQFIRKARELNKDSIIIVTGCYAQMNPDEASQIEGVDIIAGTNEKANIVNFVEEYISSGDKVSHIKEYEKLDSYEDIDLVTSMESRTRAYIKIQEGCDRFCSYCIIPFARGKVRSRRPSEIIKEAKELINSGFKELILTGINTALYGTEKGFFCDVDDEKAKQLSGLEMIIYLLNSIESDFRIRLSSLEPTVVNEEYVSNLIKYEKLCHHLHLSIQSGSDSIIKAMNRNYTRKTYLDIVKRLREFDSHYGITTDIIVGFPGENDEDFQDSRSIISEANFLKVHTFQYSNRKGTASYAMENQVAPAIKKKRSANIIEYSQKIASEFMSDSIGDVRKVLFEEFINDRNEITGYTDNYIKVYVKGHKEYINTICDVKITGLLNDGVLGEIVADKRKDDEI